MSAPEEEPSPSTTTPRPSRSQSTAQSSSSGRPPPVVPEKVTLPKPGSGYPWGPTFGPTFGGKGKFSTILPESLTNPKGKRKPPEGEEPTAGDIPASAPESSPASPVTRDDPPHQSTGDPTKDIPSSTKPNTGNPEQSSFSQQQSQDQSTSGTRKPISIPLMQEAVDEYIKIMANEDREKDPDVGTYAPCKQPLHELESLSTTDVGWFKELVVTANKAWRTHGNLFPKVYPSAQEWENLGKGITDELDKVLTFHELVGSSPGGIVHTLYFIRREQHTSFIRDLLKAIKIMQYNLRFPLPQPRVPTTYYLQALYT